MKRPKDGQERIQLIIDVEITDDMFDLFPELESKNKTYRDIPFAALMGSENPRVVDRIHAVTDIKDRSDVGFKVTNNGNWNFTYWDDSGDEIFSSDYIFLTAHHAGVVAEACQGTVPSQANVREVYECYMESHNA